MAAIARYLYNVLIYGITAMIAAILRFADSSAITHRMFAFPFVRHNVPPFLVECLFVTPLGLFGHAKLQVLADNQSYHPYIGQRTPRRRRS